MNSESTANCRQGLSSCESVVDQFAGSNEPKLQTRVAIAMVLKGVMQLECQEFKAALKTFDELIERYTINVAPNIQALVSHAYLGKTWVLLNQHDLDKSLSTYDVAVEAS